MSSTDTARYEMFRDIGRDIFLSHLISSHGGNMSVREGDYLYITRTGSMLGRLGADDVVRVPLRSRVDVEGPGAGSWPEDADASSELIVHRAIYAATDAAAVVHTHSPQTVFRSMVEDRIEPIDSEARLFMPEVPVLVSRQTVGSPEAAAAFAVALQEYPVAILRGHGPFAAADSLENAYRWVSVLEGSCEQLNLRDMVGLPLKDYLQS